MADDYYALLGLEVGADLAQLRNVWRKLAVKWHPDRAGPSATAMFQRISAAYAVLSDPVARAAYDKKRGAAAAPAVAKAQRSRRDAPEVMLTAYSGALNGLLLRGLARHADRGVIELMLDDAAARQGGMITISMPVSVRCRACNSRGKGCVMCDGRGHTEELYSAWLAVPPEVGDGTMIAPSATLPGMLWPVSFRIRVDAA